MKPANRLKRYIKTYITQTKFLQLVMLFVFLWLLFSGLLYMSERVFAGSGINTYGEALYWGVAAFSTAGIANVPISPISHFIGGLWIVIGSILFFGTIVSVITSYFMHPLQRPKRKIVDTIIAGLE